MAWTPIDLIVPQYVDVNGTPYSGAVLKAYAAGTTTNIVMATDSTGGTTFTSIALNSLGYPSNSGSICIPYVQEAYKLALYATQAAADANTPAIWSIDNLMPVINSGSFVVNDAVSSAVTNVITATHTTTGTPVAGIGTGMAFVTETSANNNETGLVIEAVTTDVTGGSEDFDLVVKLMAAGAAAAERLRVASDGTMTPVGRAVLPTGATIASATTVNLNAATGNRVHISGTTTITTVTLTKGPVTVIFDDALTLTHHATTNNLPGGANITTAAGDRAIYESDGTTVYCVFYSKASGLPIVGGDTLIRSARTSNTILGTADRGTLVEITSGTFSQTFAAAATLTSGWYVYLKNLGTGIVTLDPDGAETIDGAANFSLSPGRYAIVQCNGTALFTAMVGDIPGTNVVTVTTGNAWGATNTKIRRFLTALVNTGSAITYADSVNDGGSFTINQPGLYSIALWDGGSGAAPQIGVSVNSAQLTTDIQTITAANRLFAGQMQNTATPVSVGGAVFQFAAADVVRVHGTGANQTDADLTTQFTIRKLIAI